MDPAMLLGQAFCDAHPEDAARLLETFAPAEAVDALGQAPVRTVAGILRCVVPPQAAAILSVTPPERSAAIVAGMPRDATVTILRRMPEAAREAVLAALPAEAAEPLRAVLRYPEGTVGALMDPLAFTLPDDVAVVEARRRVRRSARDVHYYLYVVDRKRRLVGVLNLRDFMLAEPRATIGSVMRRDVARLPAGAEVAEVAVSPAWSRFQTLPLVDEQGAFVGALDYQTMRRAEAALGLTRRRQAVLDTLLAVGELYWVGMSGMLAGFTPAAGAARADSEEPSR